ncbi:MAG: DUF4097 family beta strand repeat protein [Gemmatimonadetes bacterium]|nr:DUF4097 family beta strand repeat protein [Gemmatimonadota bacterium]
MKWIRILSIFLVPCFLGLASGVQAEQRVNERVKADGGGEVYVDNIAGQVKVEGWSEKAVEVTGTIGDDLELQLERKGRRTLVSVKYPERHGSHHQVADIVVRVPVASQVSVETVSANIEARSLSGRVEIESVSGSIELDVQSKEIEAESVSGDIDLRAAKAEIDVAAISGDLQIRIQEGTVDAETVSGDLQIQMKEGIVDAETVSGDIDVIAVKLIGGDAQSISGDIGFDVALGPACRLDLEAHSGDVDLVLPSGASAEIDLETYSGSIRNRLGGEQVGGDSKRELNLLLGSGDARVDISTFSGGIQLRAK